MLNLIFKHLYGCVAAVLIYQALISSFFRAAEEVTGLHQSAHHQAQSVFFFSFYTASKGSFLQKGGRVTFFPMFKDREKRSIWEETSLLDAVEDRRVIRVNLLNKFFPFL